MRKQVATLLLGFLVTSVLWFSTGCQKQDFVNDKVIEIHKLAEMQYDSSINESLYSGIYARIKDFSNDDYILFMREWSKVETKNAINLKLVSPLDENKLIEEGFRKLMLRNSKSIELYGLPMNKITLQQQLHIVEMLESDNSSGGTQKLTASCPTYYYPYPTTNNGNGTVSCSTYSSAGNPGTTDCDWEFTFYPGPIAYNSTTLKTKGTTSSANVVLSFGGVNGRLISTNLSFIMLVGKGKINLTYPISGASGFASNFKFRGLNYS